MVGGRTRSDVAERRFRILRLAIAPAIMLHNFEEWFAFPRYGASVAEAFRRAGLAVSLPTDWRPVQALLIVVTAVATGVVASAAFGRGSPMRDALVRIVAWVLLLNVLFPHLLVAALVGGYAPGLASVVLVNLPLMSAFLLADAARRRRLRPPCPSRPPAA